MAQEEGFEPPTKRLTAACSTTELLLSSLWLRVESNDLRVVSQLPAVPLVLERPILVWVKKIPGPSMTSGLGHRP